MALFLLSVSLIVTFVLFLTVEGELKPYLLIIFLMGLCFLLLGFFKYGETRGYKKGQIDALTGTVKYQLVDNPDKSKTWELKKDGK